MVTDEKIYDPVLFKYRLGIALIWIGVLIWVPFIMLRIASEKPSIFWYLPFHLVCVVGGSRVRASARRKMNRIPLQKNALQILGHGMIVAGILVWAPYFYLKAIAPQPVEVMDFLPYHLAGVLGGIALLAVSYLLSQKNQRQA
jgi:hypothetical protein